MLKYGGYISSSMVTYGVYEGVGEEEGIHVSRGGEGRGEANSSLSVCSLSRIPTFAPAPSLLIALDFFTTFPRRRFR